MYKECSNKFLKKSFNFLFFKYLKHRTTVLQIWYKLKKSFKDHYTCHKYYQCDCGQNGWLDWLLLLQETETYIHFMIDHFHLCEIWNLLHRLSLWLHFFFIKFLTKFLNKMDVLKGRPVLVKITIVHILTQDSPYYTQLREK